MIKIKNGSTRIVFIFDNFVIKIPNFLYSHNNFLLGCIANWKERKFTKDFKCLPNYYNKISPSLFCSYFGLLQIMKKCEPLNRDITDKEILYFKDITIETKSSNFGILKDKIVCLDYE